MSFFEELSLGAGVVSEPIGEKPLIITLGDQIGMVDNMDALLGDDDFLLVQQGPSGVHISFRFPVFFSIFVCKNYLKFVFSTEINLQ